MYVGVSWAMTVKELIKMLQNMPQNLEVLSFDIYSNLSPVKPIKNHYTEQPDGTKFPVDLNAFLDGEYEKYQKKNAVAIEYVFIVS